MKHALSIALDVAVLAVLVAFCCQWASLGLGAQDHCGSPLALFESKPAAAAPGPAPEPTIGADDLPEGDFILLAGLHG